MTNSELKILVEIYVNTMISLTLKILANDYPLNIVKEAELNAIKAREKLYKALDEKP